MVMFCASGMRLLLVHWRLAQEAWPTVPAGSHSLQGPQQGRRPLLHMRLPRSRQRACAGPGEGLPCQLRQCSPLQAIANSGCLKGR